MSVAAAMYLRTTYGSRDANRRLIPPVAELAALRPAARLLWEVLANMADDRGASWPAVETLAARMGVSDANVRRARTDLARAGVLTWTPGGGRGNTNLYRVPVHPEPARHRAGCVAVADPVDDAQTDPVDDAETRAVPRANLPGEVQEKALVTSANVPEWVADRWPITITTEPVAPGATWEDMA